MGTRSQEAVPKQIRDLHEERAVRALDVGREKQRFVIVVEDEVALLVAIIVADVEHRTGVHTIGNQQVRAKRPVERVVLQDVAEQEPVGELVARLRAEDLDVEHVGLIARVDEPAGAHVERRLEPAERTQRHEHVPAGAVAQERRAAEAHLLAPVEAAAERHGPAGIDVATQGVTVLEELDPAEPLHLATDAAVEPDVLRKRGVETDLS